MNSLLPFDYPSNRRAVPHQPYYEQEWLLSWSVPELKRADVDLFGNRFIVKRSSSGYVLSLASSHLRNGKDHHVTAIVAGDEVVEVHTKIDGDKVASIPGKTFMEGITEPDFDSNTAYKLRASRLPDLDNDYMLLGMDRVKATFLSLAILPLIHLSGFMRWGKKRNRHWLRVKFDHKIICIFKVIAQLAGVMMSPAPHIIFPAVFKKLAFTKPSKFLERRPGSIGVLLHKEFRGVYWMWRKGNTILITPKRSVRESGINQLIEKAKLPRVDSLPIKSFEAELTVIE